MLHDLGQRNPLLTRTMKWPHDVKAFIVWIDEGTSWRLVVQAQQTRVPGGDLKTPADVSGHHDRDTVFGIEVFRNPPAEGGGTQAQINHDQRHAAGHACHDVGTVPAEQAMNLGSPAGVHRSNSRMPVHRETLPKRIGAEPVELPGSLGSWSRPGHASNGQLLYVHEGRLAQAAARRRTKAGQDDRRGMVSAGSRRSRGRHPRGEGRALTGGEGPPASRLYRVAHRVGPIAAVVAGPSSEHLSWNQTLHQSLGDAAERRDDRTTGPTTPRGPRCAAANVGGARCLSSTMGEERRRALRRPSDCRYAYQGAE